MNSLAAKPARCAAHSMALVVGLAAIAVRPADAAELKAGVFSPPRQAPEFSLQGSNGRELRLSNYRGRIVVLGFGYTSCPNVCPTTLATLAQATRKLGTSAAEVQVIYVTVDPDRDVPERMNKYLGNFHPTFVGGSGTAEQLSAVRKEYGILAQTKRSDKSYEVAHSSYTYLIDREGHLRAMMPYGRGPDDYAHDLAILLKE